MAKNFSPPAKSDSAKTPALPAGARPETSSKNSPAAETGKRERIAKYLARCGIASRRESEKLVEDGRISVYSTQRSRKEKITHPSALIQASDRVFMDGNPVDPPSRPLLWRYHKPAGLITTHSDPQGRPTIFENLPQDMPRVISVGRLDLNSEGLLLLTNDGALSRILELPSTALKRVYRVRVFGTVTPQALAKLSEGISVEGVHYSAIEALIETPQNSGRNTWLRVTLSEGKNREIRRVMQAIGLKVNRLIRLEYGPFALEDLPVGAVAPVSPEEASWLLPDYFATSSSAAPRTHAAISRAFSSEKNQRNRSAQDMNKKKEKEEASHHRETPKAPFSRRKEGKFSKTGAAPSPRAPSKNSAQRDDAPKPDGKNNPRKRFSADSASPPAGRSLDRRPAPQKTAPKEGETSGRPSAAGRNPRNFKRSHRR